MASVKELKKICITPKEENVPFYIRYVMRELSFPITKLFLFLKISANQTTFISLLIGLLAALLFAVGKYEYSVIAALLFQFAFVLDHVDGNIARYRKTASPKGHYYDRLVHRIMEPMIFLGIGFGAYNRFNEGYFILRGAIIAVSLLWIYSFISEKYRIFFEEKWMKKEKKKGESKKEKGILFFLKKIFDKIGFLSRIPGDMNIITIASIFNYTYIILYFYIFFMPIVALGSFIYETQIRFDKLE